ncbi:MAG TPA: AsmA-like C-terminal region-containing protein [Chitinophagaceae bacterium]|nr:AsmA-like C-terminal region-containing protein [Chitinophagaceae bacterium]
MRRYLRLLAKIAVACILLVFLTWTGIYIYFRLNKERLLQKVSETVSSRLSGEATIKDIGLNFLVNFPYITLRLEEVTLRDSMYKVHQHHLLKAKKFFISSTTFQLLKGKIEPSKIVIEDAQIFLFTDANGYTNSYITSPPAKDGETKKLSYRSLPDKIVLKDVRIVLYNLLKSKYHDLFVRRLRCGINVSDGFINFKTDVDIGVNSLAFNIGKGSFAKNKAIRGDFRMRFDTLQRELSIDKARLKIGGSPFTVTANFRFDSTRNFKLQLNTARISFRQAASLLSNKLARRLDSLDFKKPIDLQANITGRTAYKDTPYVNVRMVVKDNYVTTPQGNLEQCSFTGSYSNHVSEIVSRNDENSIIHISKLQAQWEGVPIASENIQITNLLHPVVTCDIQSNTDLSKLDELIGSESFRFVKGEARTKLYYHGPIGDSTSASPYISGSFSFNNAEIEYLPRSIKLSDINGDIIFDSSDIRLKDIKGKVQQSPVTINAEIRNFFALMDIDPGKLELNSSIYMPLLDVQQFKTLLGQRNKSASRKGGARLVKLSRSIDRFMDVCNMNTSLQADKVQYKRFTATDVKANVYLASNTWRFNKVSLKHADGLLDLDGELETMPQNNHRFNMNAQLQRINISRLFQAFNDFGLQDVSAENIRGLLTTSINLSGMLDADATPIPSSLQGVIDLSLLKGELINFEPLQKMSLFLLKKRDFSNLEFAELKNRIQVQGQSIIINRMEVQSTALSMYVEGLYDLRGDSTDLVIQVPLSNLKKRKPDYVPENKGLDAKTGMSVYVRARSDKGDDIDFSVGLFRKKSVLEKRKSSKNGKP